jgi:hypothetical protein
MNDNKSVPVKNASDRPRVWLAATDLLNDILPYTLDRGLTPHESIHVAFIVTATIAAQAGFTKQEFEHYVLGMININFDEMKRLIDEERSHKR